MNMKMEKNNGNVELSNIKELQRKIKILRFQNTLSQENPNRDIRKLKKSIARELTLLNSKKNKIEK